MYNHYNAFNQLKDNLQIGLKWLFILFLTILTACTDHQSEVELPQPKQRLLVLTDIEADPDDAQTLIRLLLYTNQIDLEGLIATTSVHQKTMVSPESIYQILNAYEKILHNLKQHEAGFPDTDKLRALVKPALPLYGMKGVGEAHDSQGSNWLIKTLEKPDPRPLWVSVWGGVNTLAQALYRLKQSKSTDELNALVAKLRVYSISDQDDSAAWLRKQFPQLFFIVSPGGYGAATWTGISAVVDGLDNTTISNAWLAENIQQSHGPLGAQYPDVAYGMEGDTPSWLNLIPNGLNTPEHPNWGGWGGRYELYIPKLENTDPSGFTGGVPVAQETRAIWSNAIDSYVPPATGTYGRSIAQGNKTYKGYKETLWRWRDAIQNDFAARMDWTIKPYEDANHPPVVNLKHRPTITVTSGSSFHLDARGSSDPDGDSLQYYWFNYPEAGTMKERPVKIHSAENMARVHIVAPLVSKTETLHFILMLTDRGKPALTRYQRVIVNVVPE